MNIFFLDWDVKKCAEYHCDKHVVKMVLETAQLLCTAHHVVNPVSEPPYRIVHKNHPCSIWVRESLSNYLYLTELGLALCDEYTYRYGKRHKSQDVVEWSVINKLNIQDLGLTPPPKAMPEEFKVVDVIQSYRNYYNGPKRDFLSWKKREMPKWVSNQISKF